VTATSTNRLLRYVESLNRGLATAMENDPRVLLMGEDIVDPYGGAFKVTRGLSTRFPDRVITTPISEAGITGVASGMAIRGLRPVVEIMFGDFITLCADQLVNGATKFSWMYNDQFEVPLVIRCPMGGGRGYGPTHSQTLESLYMGVAGITIIAPSHYHDPGNILQTILTHEMSPVLFIENKLLYPEYLSVPDSSGWVGNLHVDVAPGSDDRYPVMRLTPDPGQAPDVTLVTYGGMAIASTTAAVNLFLQEEINVEILLPALIKPFPSDNVVTSVESSGRLVIAEEGIKTGGWGAELASQVMERSFDVMKVPAIRVGAKDSPIPSSRGIEDAVLPQSSDIETAIYEVLK
jgi:pyruvate/2-oxoglutarate/acetoin dehydrogenase E1 component